MEVEIIKAKGAGEDTSTGRKIDRLRVAAYCRVSTDDEDQIKSYNSMVRYYTDLIKSNKQWVFAGVFADKAITGTKTDKREEFQLLIQECLSGNIDLVIAKSIPRFARNTLDTLKYVRMLRERNIAVYFEVEKIFTDYFKFCCTAGSGKYICICKKRFENEDETWRTCWFSGMPWI